MHIFLIIKCGFLDAFYFITQLSRISNVDKVTVFRDSESLNDNKIDYITPGIQRITLIKLLIRLFQIFKRKYLKPDIIIGIYEIPHGLLAVIVGKLFHKPAVVSIIGNPAYTKLRKGFRMKLTMWILNNADFITVTGNTSRRFLISKGIPDEKVFVLPNTMDFSEFYPIPDAKMEYDIISLGRLSDEKKVDQIVRIIGELKKTNPHIKAAIGGTGPEKESIIRLIKDLDLERNIEVLGFIPDEVLPAFFSKGKVFLLTSETEGFPRTIIQAAACGAAVVATNVGDMTDVIEHDVNGFLVDSYQDIDSFVMFTQILLTDQGKAVDFITSLDKKVRTQFANEQGTIVWKKILDEISKKKF